LISFSSRLNTKYSINNKVIKGKSVNKKEKPKLLDEKFTIKAKQRLQKEVLIRILVND